MKHEGSNIQQRMFEKSALENPIEKRTDIIQNKQRQQLRANQNLACSRDVRRGETGGSWIRNHRP